MSLRFEDFVEQLEFNGYCCSHSHRSCAVRDGTANLLCMLANKMGVKKVLESETFVTAVTTMCVDASPTTRYVTFRLLTSTLGPAVQKRQLGVM